MEITNNEYYLRYCDMRLVFTKHVCTCEVFYNLLSESILVDVAKRLGKLLFSAVNPCNFYNFVIFYVTLYVTKLC